MRKVQEKKRIRDQRQTKRVMSLLGYIWIIGGALILFWLGKTCAAGGEDYSSHSRLAERLDLKDPLGILRSHSEFLWHVTARVIAAVLRRIGLADRYGDGIVIFSGQIASGLFVAIAFLLTCYFLRKNVSGLRQWQAAVLGMIIHTASSIFLPGFSVTPYRGQGSFNPWHNPTTIALRPFMILFMCLLCEDLLKASRSDFKKLMTKGRIVLLAGILLLTNMAKPSFVQCFFPAVFLMMIIWLFRYKGRNLKFALQLVLVCLPSAFYTLFQIWLNFGSGSKRGVQILPFAAISYATSCIPLSVLLLQAFPLTMLILGMVYGRKEPRFSAGSGPTGSFTVLNVFDAEHEISFLIWLMAFLEKMLLAETGKQMYYGNFGWAYESASAWCFYVAVKDYAELFLTKGHPQSRKGPGFFIATAILSLHVISGIYYLYWIIGMGHSM